MRFLGDRVIMLRVLGAGLLFGLLGLAAYAWRESIVDGGTYDTSSYEAANNLLHTCWFFAIIALVYVGIALMLTPGEKASS